MRNSLNKVIAFAAGAAVGSAVTWRILKPYYEQILKEELESMKDFYMNRQSEPVEDNTESESKRYLEEVAKPFAEGLADGIADGVQANQFDIKEYAEQLQTMDYVDYSGHSKPKTTKTTKKKKSAKKPPSHYVIPPEEFGEMDGYTTCSLTYYADEVLTDENDNIIEDVDDIVGLDSLSHFGEYEDDSVFVRNDNRRCDYEILLDPRKFEDVVNNSPHQAEEEWDETN